MRRIAGIIIAAALGLPANVQGQQADFGATVEVRVANVDVSVTDRSGRPVRGLPASDFVLLVDGKETPISNFYEASEPSSAPVQSERGASATVKPAVLEPVVERRRTVAFVIDTYSLDLRQRNSALVSLRKFVDQNVRPGDVAMLAVWNRRMIIPLTLTSDRGAIKRELEKLEKGSAGGYGRDRQIVEMRVRSAMQEAEVGGGRNPIAAAQQAYGFALSHVNHYAEEQAKIAENFTAGLEELFRGLAGVEGKKIVVMIGENFPQYPALGSYQFVNEVFSRFAGSINFAVPQTLATQRALSSLPARLTRAANASEITLHTIYTGESDVEGGVESQESPGERMMSRQLDFTNTGSTFAVISRDTGGVALLGSRNFDGAAAQIAADLTSYYSLGYRSEGDSRARRVEVRTRNRELVVRARRAIVERSLDQEIADRVTSRLFQGGTSDSTEISVAVGNVVRERRDRIRVPITVRFPSSLLTLIPRDGRSVGGFEIIVAASDHEKRLSEESRKIQEVGWPEGRVPSQIEFSMDVLVRNMPGELSVGVVDRLSKTPYYRRLAVTSKKR